MDHRGINAFNFYVYTGIVAVVVMLLVPILAGSAYGASITTLSGAILDDEIDYTYGPVVNRTPSGSIKRSARVLKAFAALHPCPSTGEHSTTCPGWNINHKTPLACGGLDAVFNMQWLPVDIKHCAGPHCVDSFERKINAYEPKVTASPACNNQVVQ